MARRWYAAVVKTGQEQLAVRELARQKNVVTSTFSPRQRVARYFRGEEVFVIRPWLPGYLLVQFDRDLHQWRSINGTRGVIRLLMCGEVPIPIRRGVVEKMIAEHGGRRGYARDERLERLLAEEAKSKVSYAHGESVRITAGPFVELVGKVIKSGADKIAIMLDVLGREVPVNIDRESISKLSITAAAAA